MVKIQSKSKSNIKKRRVKTELKEQTYERNHDKLEKLNVNNRKVSMKFPWESQMRVQFD